MNLKWDKRYMEMARMVANWSKDPGSKCGTVIVRPDKTVCSLGFNGFPRNMKDDDPLYKDKLIKYSRVIHSEMNAILNSSESVKGYTMYCWPGNPCDRCAVHAIQAGISRIVYGDEGKSHMNSGEMSIRVHHMCLEAQIDYECFGSL